MRKRSHRSATVLAALMAWLLVVPGGANADSFCCGFGNEPISSIIVPLKVTYLHPEVTAVKVRVDLKCQSENYLCSGSNGMTLQDPGSPLTPEFGDPETFLTVAWGISEEIPVVRQRLDYEAEESYSVGQDVDVQMSMGPAFDFPDNYSTAKATRYKISLMLIHPDNPTGCSPRSKPYGVLGGDGFPPTWDGQETDCEGKEWAQMEQRNTSWRKIRKNPGNTNLHDSYDLDIEE